MARGPRGTSRVRSTMVITKEPLVLFAVAILFLQLTPAAHAIPIAAVSEAIIANSADPLPAAPVAKAPASDADTSSASTSRADTPDPAGAGFQESQSLSTIHVPELPPAKPVKFVDVEAVPSRRTWLLLSVAQHSAAAFDAYSTRVAISHGAVERNPFIRPFSDSPAIYAAIQLTPVALDFIARRMQRSRNGLLRRTWWLPQTVSTGVFLFAGAHNLNVANRP
jgi:hypothetical protein